MTRNQAFRKAIKLFGKTAGIQDYKRPSSHESREIARGEMKALNEKCTTPELRKQFSKERDDVLSRAMYYRYSIGRVEMGLFFAVKACGDSWEGAFAAWEAKPEATQYEKPQQLAA